MFAYIKTIEKNEVNHHKYFEMEYEEELSRPILNSYQWGYLILGLASSFVIVLISAIIFWFFVIFLLPSLPLFIIAMYKMAIQRRKYCRKAERKVLVEGSGGFVIST